MPSILLKSHHYWQFLVCLSILIKLIQILTTVDLSEPYSHQLDFKMSCVWGLFFIYLLFFLEECHSVRTKTPRCCRGKSAGRRWLLDRARFAECGPRIKIPIQSVLSFGALTMITEEPGGKSSNHV